MGHIARRRLGRNGSGLYGGRHDEGALRRRNEEARRRGGLPAQERATRGALSGIWRAPREAAAPGNAGATKARAPFDG